MTEDFTGKLLNSLLSISEGLRKLEPIPVLEDYSFWLSLVGTLALVLTLVFVIKYTNATKKMARATEKLAEYQVISAVDVNVGYNKHSRKTYFWFSNESNFPGWANIKYEGNNSTKGDLRLRIAPNIKGIKTADSFFCEPKDNDTIKLSVLIEPVFEKVGDEKIGLEVKFEKSYKFEKDRWNETSWGYPDKQFPFPQKTKRCSECKSEIDFEAKKCRYCHSVLNDKEIKDGD